MVKKNKKTSRLEQALDETLDRFLETVKVEEKEETKGQEDLGFTLADGSTYILSPEEEKKLSDLAVEKDQQITNLIGKAVGEYLQREEKYFSKEVIKKELFFWQKKIEAVQEGKAESDLSSKERKVLLSYLRQLARGTWEE